LGLVEASGFPLEESHFLRLLCFVGFEDGAGLAEVDSLSVHDEFVVAGVCGDGVDVFNSVTVGSELLNDELNVWHGPTLQEVAGVRDRMDRWRLGGPQGEGGCRSVAPAGYG